MKVFDSMARGRTLLDCKFHALHLAGFHAVNLELDEAIAKEMRNPGLMTLQPGVRLDSNHWCPEYVLVLEFLPLEIVTY